MSRSTPLARSAENLARFAAALATFAGVVGGVPLLLTFAARQRFGSSMPMHGVDAPWRWSPRRIWESLSSELTDDTVVDVVLRSCLLVVWAAVVVIAVNVVVEVVHMVRHQGIPTPHVRGLGWSQRLARTIAAGLLSLTPLVTGPVAAAAPPAPAVASGPATAAVVGDRPVLLTAAPTTLAPPVGSSASPTVPGASSMSSYVVQPGDSVYGIAERIAGSDTSRVTAVANQILDANLGTTMAGGARFVNPAYIEVGWVLQVPALPGAVAPDVPLTAAPQSVAPDEGRTMHVVERGDTLWDIAGDTYGDPTEWPTIWEANAGETMNDGRVFDDPNLIVVGWELAVPDDPATLVVDVSPPAADASLAADAVAPVADPSLAADAVAPVADPSLAADAVAPVADPPLADPASGLPEAIDHLPAGSAPGASQTDSPSADADDAVATSPAMAAPSASSTPPPAEQESSSSSAPAPLGLGGAALLSAGVLTLVGVRRTMRLRASSPRARVPEPPAEVVAVERALRTVDAGERLLRVDIAVRAAAATLAAGPAQILVVVVDRDGALELVLSSPAELPAPWVGDGSSWRLPAGTPVELLATEARTVGAPCLALTQIGVATGDRDVLVDLEALGVLAISAPAEVGDAVVRAVAASLATSVFAEVAHLVGVGLDSGAFVGHRHAHHVATVAEAVELATVTVGSTAGSATSTFALRARHTGGEVWEPAIVIVASSAAAGAGEHVAAIARRPARGRAAVVAGSCAGAEWRLVAGGTAWRLEPLGIELVPIGLSAVELRAIEDVVAHADRLELQTAHDELATPLVHDLVPPGAATADALDRDPEGDFVEQPWQLMVRLVGPVGVEDRRGSAASFERSKALELVAWLVLHRDRGTRVGARTALWDLDVRDATFANVVSDARRGMARLVAPPEGDEWLARTMTEQLPLHPEVVSDVELMAARLEHARVQPPTLAIATLRPALELVRDLPFSGTSYLWPDAEGTTSNLVLLATSIASELASHYLSLGDVEGVFWATGQGLKVLTGHEELIGLRMRAHARAGDLAGVRREWESYERVLVADPWSDGEPAPKLLALRKQLLSPSS
jgi:nucleoid-associated protein YgaU